MAPLNGCQPIASARVQPLDQWDGGKGYIICLFWVQVKQQNVQYPLQCLDPSWCNVETLADLKVFI